MMGIAGMDDYITPAMVQDGDDVIMTKGSAIEATAVLARVFPETVRHHLGEGVAKKAREHFHLCSTFRDAVVASSVGVRSEGVTSMHDATEGGVLGALFELARSSKRTLSVDRRKLILSKECESVCRLFGLDPFVTVSEGTLLATCRPHRSAEVLKRLSKNSIDAAVIGRAGKREWGRLMVRADSGRYSEHVPPKYDPYWEAYSQGVEKGWK